MRGRQSALARPGRPTAQETSHSARPVVGSSRRALFALFLATAHSLQELGSSSGIAFGSSAVKVWRPSHWSARESPQSSFHNTLLLALPG